MEYPSSQAAGKRHLISSIIFQIQISQAAAKFAR